MVSKLEHQFQLPVGGINETLGSEFQIWVKIWKFKEVQKPGIVISKKWLKILWKICYQKYVA